MVIIGLAFSILGKTAYIWNYVGGNSILYTFICFITVVVGWILMVVGILWWISRKRDKHSEGENNHTPAP